MGEEGGGLVEWGEGITLPPTANGRPLDSLCVFVYLNKEKNNCCITGDLEWSSITHSTTDCGRIEPCSNAATTCKDKGKGEGLRSFFRQSFFFFFASSITREQNWKIMQMGRPFLFLLLLGPFSSLLPVGTLTEDFYLWPATQLLVVAGNHDLTLKCEARNERFACVLCLCRDKRLPLFLLSLL